MSGRCKFHGEADKVTSHSLGRTVFEYQLGRRLGDVRVPWCPLRAGGHPTVTGPGSAAVASRAAAKTVSKLAWHQAGGGLEADAGMAVATVAWPRAHHCHHTKPRLDGS